MTSLPVLTSRAKRLRCRDAKLGSDVEFRRGNSSGEAARYLDRWAGELVRRAGRTGAGILGQRGPRHEAPGHVGCPPRRLGHQWKAWTSTPISRICFRRWPTRTLSTYRRRPGCRLPCRTPVHEGPRRIHWAVQRESAGGSACSGEVRGTGRHHRYSSRPGARANSSFSERRPYGWTSCGVSMGLRFVDAYPRRVTVDWGGVRFR